MPKFIMAPLKLVEGQEKLSVYEPSGGLEITLPLRKFQE